MHTPCSEAHFWGRIIIHGRDNWRVWTAQKVVKAMSKEAVYGRDGVCHAEFLFAWWGERAGKN